MVALNRAGNIVELFLKSLAFIHRRMVYTEENNQVLFTPLVLIPLFFVQNSNFLPVMAFLKQKNRTTCEFN
jgi:hypothetical protein